MSDWCADRRFCVTGGAGFLGRWVVRELQRRGARHIFVPRTSRGYDLTTLYGVRYMYDDAQPDVLIHLAADVGGIGDNQARPADMLYRNAIMGLYVMEEARAGNIEKVVVIGSACAYPAEGRTPIAETQLWAGYPEPTNAPYGLAKRILLAQCTAYRAQHDLNAIYLIPANLYGPGDNFDPATSHVIPALIRKCIEAREAGAPRIKAWGSGSATRDFLYVEDAARGIVDATERYDGPLPINLGTETEYDIRSVARMIQRKTGYRVPINWDIARPDGQRRRCLSIGRAKQLLDFSARTALPEGLSRTIDWYERERKR